MLRYLTWFTTQNYQSRNAIIFTNLLLRNTRLKWLNKMLKVTQVRNELGNSLQVFIINNDLN